MMNHNDRGTKSASGGSLLVRTGPDRMTEEGTLLRPTDQSVRPPLVHRLQRMAAKQLLLITAT